MSIPQLKLRINYDKLAKLSRFKLAKLSMGEISVKTLSGVGNFPLNFSKLLDINLRLVLKIPADQNIANFFRSRSKNLNFWMI